MARYTAVLGVFAQMKHYAPGDTLELSDEQAKGLLDAGAVRLLEDKSVAKSEPAAESPPTEDTESAPLYSPESSKGTGPRRR